MSLKEDILGEGPEDSIFREPPRIVEDGIEDVRSFFKYDYGHRESTLDELSNAELAQRIGRKTFP